MRLPACRSPIGEDDDDDNSLLRLFQTGEYKRAQQRVGHASLERARRLFITRSVFRSPRWTHSHSPNSSPSLASRPVLVNCNRSSFLSDKCFCLRWNATDVSLAEITKSSHYSIESPIQFTKREKPTDIHQRSVSSVESRDVGERWWSIKVDSLISHLHRADEGRRFESPPWLWLDRHASIEESNETSSTSSTRRSHSDSFTAYLSCINYGRSWEFVPTDNRQRSEMMVRLLDLISIIIKWESVQSYGGRNIISISSKRDLTWSRS